MPGFDGAYSASRCRLITPSDTNLLEPRPDGLLVNGAGDVVIEDADGQQSTLKANAGGVLPVSPRRVLATGTTATGIHGLRP